MCTTVMKIVYVINGLLSNIKEEETLDSAHYFLSSKWIYQLHEQKQCLE